MRDPFRPALPPPIEWYAAISNIGWAIDRTANAYSMGCQDSLNEEYYHFLQHRTRWVIEHYIGAGCWRCGFEPVTLLDNRPIPQLWAEVDDVFQNQAQRLHADIRRCRLTDHGLRAAIFELVYGWLPDEFTKAFAAFDQDPHIEMARLVLLTQIDDSREIRELARRESPQDSQYDRIDNALMALEDRLKELELLDL